MNFDITSLLDQWEYQPGKLSVRKFKGKDGTEKIQLRIDLGLMQLNADGRPDGKRPFGHPSLFDHFRAQSTKKGDDFMLTDDDLAKLHQEAIQFHHRYICFFQLEDFEGVLRDTTRNIEALNFATEHAEHEELVAPMKHFLPQLLMLQTRARATMELEAKNHDTALAAIETGLESIRAFYREQGRDDLTGHSGELASLEAWHDELVNKRPLSEREKLERALADAVQNEDYEKAAQVRDALRHLK
ncbi:MAG: UvrB/UvrC motif-containing protein [Verrucomicrobia bacterium]|nr:UvrB/UvrC motif-containing protein [Verrucomicrobiota bacterium]